MQYIVNQVVYDLEVKGITPEDINSFSCGVRGLQQKLKATFFSDRYVRKRNKHIRAFGSEVITALDVLCLLLQVLGCGGPQLDIITKARLVMSVLLSGDAAARQCDRLEAYMYNLHCAFLVMYPECATPKLHLMRHILDALEHFRRNFHCMGGRGCTGGRRRSARLPTTNLIGRPSREACGLRFETFRRLTTTNTPGWETP